MSALNASTSWRRMVRRIGLSLILLASVTAATAGPVFLQVRVRNRFFEPGKTVPDRVKNPDVDYGNNPDYDTHKYIERDFHQRIYQVIVRNRKGRRFSEVGAGDNGGHGRRYRIRNEGPRPRCNTWATTLHP